MKKLLLILVALFVAFGWEVQGADIVETFESFTDAKQAWLPTQLNLRPRQIIPLR